MARHLSGKSNRRDVVSSVDRPVPTRFTVPGIVIVLMTNVIILSESVPESVIGIARARDQNGLGTLIGMVRNTHVHRN